MGNLAKPLGVIVGAILVFRGSYLTWVSVDVGFATFSTTGTETTDGELTLAAARVMFVAGLALLLRGRAQLAVAFVGLVVAGHAAVVLVTDYSDMPGLQVWSTAVLVAAVIVGGLVLLARNRGELTAALVGFVAAGYAAIVLVNDYMDVRQRIAESGDQASATVGLGVWLTGIGSLIALGMLIWAIWSAMRTDQEALV
ncbi:MAG: hypothetical protein QNJ88_07690 [Acidimicrobiia bacterium]|nr:hypothetical protein [Acidimicrobiia bacterium]